MAVAPLDTRNARELVEARVLERSEHRSAEAVATTCSLARAERLLGREYHGRFLIELLQNAADAWLRSAESAHRRSRVHIVVDPNGPALVVGNEGEHFPVQVVLDSLGHIGASTKAQGEAIGHKGIGFKSVLEVSRTPELYSGFDGDQPALALRFDAEVALERIRLASVDWDAHAGGLRDVVRPTDAVPVLRYPHWVEDVPAVVRELAGLGCSTVVRLPLGAGEDVDAWLATVRAARRHVTDEMLLLLGTFEQVTVDDRLSGERTVVAPTWTASTVLDGGVVRERVEVRRDGARSSSWELFRSGVRDADGGGLAQETAVGVRVAAQEDGRVVVEPAVGEANAPFHLFFPTRIASGLPFLLHGYFEVDAARTGFYAGSTATNGAVLGRLADLTARAVADLAERRAVDLASLVNLVAAAAEPDDPSAAAFRAGVLDRLDDVAWVPAGGDAARPTDLLLTGDARLDEALARTFPAPYVAARTGLRLPAPTLGDGARRLLLGRRPADAPDAWHLVTALLRPADLAPWSAEEAGPGFLALLDLVQALETLDRTRAADLLEALRGDPATRLLPVPAPDGSVRLLPLPDPGEGRAGRLSTLVMGRVRTARGAPLQPPAAMNVAFLPDGLLRSEADGDRAKPLGVRPFTVDTVLDRLGALPGTRDPEVVTFLWTLLARERGSEHGTAEARRRAATFDPAAWFWLRPDRDESTDNERAKQRRERLLSTVLLPARDGDWRPAGELAFGADWASWLTGGSTQVDSATAARARSYAALEQVAPSAADLLAPPEVLLPLLPDLALAVETAAGDEAHASDADEGAAAGDRERHAFLLRLGVWEVVPLDAHADARAGADDAPRPWAAERETLAPGHDAEPWNFGASTWSGRGHARLRVSEDVRLRWPLPQASVPARLAMTRALAAGTGLYARLATAAAFCPACSDNGSRHTVRYRTAPDERRPSTLALQLRALDWLPTTTAGVPADDGVRPDRAWWAENPPGAAGMITSPLRFLPLCHPEADLPGGLRELLDLPDLAHAPAARLEALLRELAAGVATRLLPEAGAHGSRQALLGLHRLVYERLANLGTEGTAVLDRVGVLCEVDGGLQLVPREQARHDDGRYATYRRHFTGLLPFAALAREKTAVAKGLGLRPFEVVLNRRGDDEGTDVTGDLQDALAERVPELLAVLVHHSLGAQTLEPASEEFVRRSRRLQALTVRQVSDLVLDLQEDGSGATVTLGRESAQDVFLAQPTSAAPVLFHDLQGADWAARLRPRLAAPLAAVVENAAYAATFQLLLVAEGENEREAVLHDLGISLDDVAAVRAALGAVTDDDRRAYRRWYAALLTERGRPVGPDEVELEHDALVTALTSAGLPREAAEALVVAGGADAVRRDEDGVLRQLVAVGVDLRALHERLLLLGERGLQVLAARTVLRRWIALHERRTAAVMAPHVGEVQAKQLAHGWQVPEHLRFALDPDPVEVLAPIVADLGRAGLAVDAARLADDAAAELARAAGAAPDELDTRVAQLYDAEERRALLARNAAAWREELVLLGVLARGTAGETRAAVRGHAEAVRRTVPSAAAAPSALAAALSEVLPERAGLVDALTALLDDAVTATPPDRAFLLETASQHGLRVDRAEAVLTALAAPTRQLVAQVRDRAARLAQAGLAPVAPPGLTAPPARDRSSAGRKRPVTAVHVDAKLDRRKRELGAEGERWALACVVQPLLALAAAERAAAVDAVAAFLGRWWSGPVVAAALQHVDAARAPGTDEEDLIAALAGLLHVSQHSDAFGFDLLGWLPPRPGEAARPVALEVKSSSGGGFLLSLSEWREAERLHAHEEGDGYAVLVVRRGKTADPPAHLHLLADPVALVATQQLRREPEGWSLQYRTSD